MKTHFKSENQMKIAIVNTAYLERGGAERADEVFGKIFPNADVYTLFANRSAIPNSLKNRQLTTSFLDSIPGILHLYRLCYPIYPIAIRSLDLRGYDLVLSSDYGAVKGVITSPNTVHVCYCHTPWRQVWDLYWNALEKVPKMLRPIYAAVAEYLRSFDYQAAQGVDYFIANSTYTQRRIWKYYKRKSTVLYGPANTETGYVAKTTDDYYLSVGRLSSLKRIDLLIEACNRLKRRLVVVGTRNTEKQLRKISGSTIEFLGYIPDERLPEIYAHCRALLFASDEDLGLVPIEAQAYGRPVIAYGYGGVLDTVRAGDRLNSAKTGVFYHEQTVDSVIKAILEFEQTENQFIPSLIQKNAKQFSEKIFIDEVKRFIAKAISKSSESANGVDDNEN